MYRKFLACLICVLMLFLAACGGVEENTESKPKEVSSEVKAPEPVYYVNNLTGEQNLTDEALVNRRPVAIMINNAWEGTRGDAQSVQTGLSKADIVYETEVEGGITRLMAVFKDISKVEKIGTVRSARYPYIDLSMGHDAIYVHHGQDNNYAKPHLRDTQTFVLGTNNAGTRIKNGKAYEHTLYGYGDKIWKWFEKKNYDIEIKDSKNWQNFADKDAKITYASAAETVTVEYSTKYRSIFKYDAKSGKYVRYFRDILRKDYFTGETETFKNVFVLSTSITYYPDNKHKKVDLSSGSGYYCVNGTYTPIKWSKGSSSSSLKFTTTDGKPLEVSQGNSWVCFHSKKYTPKFDGAPKAEINTSAVTSAKN